MTEKKILEKWKLIDFAQEDMEKDCENKESEIYKNFSLDTEEGLKFYRSLDNEFLLDILKKRAAELGHSPAQSEIFWVWRSYIM